MSPSVYRRLPGSGRSSTAALSTRHRLWLAPDHLLAVSNQGYSEEYKRFLLRDIQSIAIRHTWRGRVTSIVFGAMAAAFAAPALYGAGQGWDPVGLWIRGVFAGAFALALLVNTALGPTCACTLRTAVQSERLYSLDRVRTALRAVRMIREAAASVQGALSAEDVDAAAARTAASGVATTARSHAARPLTAVGTRPYRGRSHAALFTVLLVDAVHSAAQFAWQSTVMYVLSIAILMSMLVSLILAMIRQADTDLPRSIKTTTLCTMGYVIVAYIANSIVFYVMLVMAGDSQKPPQDIWTMARSMWMTSPFESVPMMVMLIFSTVCSTILGLVGWSQLRAFLRERAAGRPAMPPGPAVG